MASSALPQIDAVPTVAGVSPDSLKSSSRLVPALIPVGTFVEPLGPEADPPSSRDDDDTSGDDVCFEGNIGAKVLHGKWWDNK